mmetsp:Transcript_21499/g.46924  ORF Transcript_21499/g.46924 Transcript_21499/m.46924 type:complete len:251 (+) Transcript_21499:1372-2124(+)
MDWAPVGLRISLHHQLPVVNPAFLPMLMWVLGTLVPPSVPIFRLPFFLPHLPQRLMLPMLMSLWRLQSLVYLLPGSFLNFQCVVVVVVVVLQLLLLSVTFLSLVVLAVSFLAVPSAFLVAPVLAFAAATSTTAVVLPLVLFALARRLPVPSRSDRTVGPISLPERSGEGARPVAALPSPTEQQAIVRLKLEPERCPDCHRHPVGDALPCCSGPGWYAYSHWRWHLLPRHCGCYVIADCTSLIAFLCTCAR